LNPRPPLLHPVIAAGVLLNLVLLIVGVVAIRADFEWARHWVKDDGLIEWMQFLCFAAMSLWFGLVAVERWREAGGLRLEVLVLGGMCGLLALVALEEVSWFQRVLNVATPEFFQKHNRQAETNLHNLTINGFNVNRNILVKLIFIIGITHNVVLPVLALKRPRLRERIEAWGGYLPPLSAALLYLGFVVLSQVLVDHDRRGEMGELFGAVHYLTTAFAAYGLGLGYGRAPLFAAQPEARRMAALFVLFLGYLVFMAWLLGAGYLGRTPL
jgi:hypothetical protein